MSASPKKSWKWGCAGIIVICVVLAYGQWFFWGYVSVSTLPVREEAEAKLEDVCVEPPPNRKLPSYLDEDEYYPLLIWPPVVWGQSIPAYSPDSKYYVDVVHIHYRDAEELRLYEVESNRLLGRYSFQQLYIPCWAKDSSGIYFSEHAGRGGIFTLDILPYYDGPLKKGLVPCRGSLEGVPLLPKLYWEVRCRIGGR